MRGDEKREKQRINRLHVEDVQFERVRHDKIKPQTDDTQVSRKQITTEKVAVNRRGVTKLEETKKSKYPKEVDVGRIVIEEIPEEKEQISRRDDKQRGTDVTLRRQEVRDVTKDREKDDTVKIGRLDLCDLENEAVVSTKTEKRLVTTRDKIDHGKFITDRHIGMKTTREPTVTEEKLKMGSGPTDKICINFSKTGQQKLDKTDGRWIVDEKTSEKSVIKDVDVVRGHEIVNDSVWKESLKPLDEEQQESIVPEKPVPSETIVVAKEDRKKQTEDVKVSVHKVESAGDKEEIKIRRFKIDESRDPKGVKKNEAINEIPVKGVKRKEEPKPHQKPKEPKERRSKEMETKTREKVQRQDKNLEQYEKKERSRRIREHQRYDEECYQMKKSSSDPWIQVRKQKKPQDFEIRATQVIHDPAKYMQEYDQSAGRKRATLPWIEVRKRASEKQRGKSLAAGKKSRHGYQLTKEQVERDRLLLLKIPQKIFISTQSGGQSITKEVEIPWMEIEASRDVDGDGLPWIQLEAHDSKTERDRLIMLKIPREMVLKTSKSSKNTEREIQLSWNDVTRYWEETGQIPLGSATHMRTKHSPCMSITLPQESSGRLKVNRNQAIDDSLPTIRLIMPKKLYAEKSWQDKPLINFDPNRLIKLRINNQFNSAEDVRTIRLGEYERKNNYVPVALTRGYPRRVLLADGMEWKRLEVDNLERLDKEVVQCNPSRFSNAYEIGAEGESRSFPDLREFAKENGGNSTENPKVFSFVIKGDK